MQSQTAQNSNSARSKFVRVYFLKKKLYMIFDLRDTLSQTEICVTTPYNITKNRFVDFIDYATTGENAQYSTLFKKQKG